MLLFTKSATKVTAVTLVVSYQCIGLGMAVPYHPRPRFGGFYKYGLVSLFDFKIFGEFLRGASYFKLVSDIEKGTNDSEG